MIDYVYLKGILIAVIEYVLKKRRAIMTEQIDDLNICCKNTCCASGCCSDGCNTGECSNSCCSDGCCSEADNCCKD